jgi:hypothetical protein
VEKVILTGAFCPKSQESPEDGPPPRHILGNARCLAVKPDGWKSTTAAFVSCLPNIRRQGNRTSELCEELAKVIVLPAGEFELAAQGSFGVVLAHDVEGHMASHSEVVGTVVQAISGLIFVHDDVEAPVQAVLNAPMGAMFCAMTAPPTSDPTLCQFLRAMHAILFRWK